MTSVSQARATAAASHGHGVAGTRTRTHASLSECSEGRVRFAGTVPVRKPPGLSQRKCGQQRPRAQQSAEEWLPRRYSVVLCRRRGPGGPVRAEHESRLQVTVRPRLPAVAIAIHYTGIIQHNFNKSRPPLSPTTHKLQLHGTPHDRLL